MESDADVRKQCAECENLKMLGRIFRRGPRRRDRESKAPVVAMIANEHASFGASRPQGFKARLDELRAHAAPLKGRLDRDWAKGKPAL